MRDRIRSLDTRTSRLCYITQRKRKKITHNWLFRIYFLFYFIIILMYCVGLIITRSSSLMYFLVERHRPSVLAEPHSDPFWSLIGTIFNWDSFFFFKEWILYKDVEIVIDKRIKIKTVPFRLSGRNGREITQTPRNSGKIRNVFSNLPQVSRRFGRRRVVRRRHDKALSDSRVRLKGLDYQHTSARKSVRNNFVRSRFRRFELFLL